MDKILLYIIKVKIKIINIVYNNVLSNNIIIFLISEVLFNPVSFIITFY